MCEVGYGTRSMSIHAYRKMKIRMLERDFRFPLTAEEKNHINELNTEIEIDRYARTIFKKYWD